MSSTAAAFSLVQIATPNMDVATKLARYCWKGKIEDSAESLLIVKTRSTLLPELTGFVKQNHPYEVVEVLALPVQGGNAEYLQWLGENLK